MNIENIINCLASNQNRPNIILSLEEAKSVLKLGLQRKLNVEKSCCLANLLPTRSITI